MSSLDCKIYNLTEKYGKATVLGLENIRLLLQAMGNPHLKMPPAVHIAGTNGKGSTAAFLRAMCEAEGKKVHLYTSPHLVAFNERIVLAGQQIDDATLDSYLARVDKVAEENLLTPTFFELATAAAFLAFSEVPADVLILETGLGGRLDASNIVPAVASAIITSISKDHTEFLGDTLEKIAFEKAGVIKPDSVAVIAKADETVLDVIRQVAKERKAKLLIEGKDFTLQEKGNGFTRTDSAFIYNGTAYPSPALFGRHQYHNASLAITVAKQVLGLSDQAIRKGLQTVRWQGRLQILTSGELTAMVEKYNLPCEMWVDGGHNEGAAEVLSDFLPLLKDKKLYGVFGMIKTKNPSVFLGKIGKLFDKIYSVPISQEHDFYSGEELVQTGRKLGLEIVPSASYQSAAEEILMQEKAAIQANGGRILILGSLYLLGEVFKHNG